MYVFTRQIFDMYKTVAGQRRGRGFNCHKLYVLGITFVMKVEVDSYRIADFPLNMPLYLNI